MIKKIKRLFASRKKSGIDILKRTLENKKMIKILETYEAGAKVNSGTPIDITKIYYFKKHGFYALMCCGFDLYINLDEKTFDKAFVDMEYMDD